MGIGDACNKSEIISEYTKDQFIRNAWITLAKEDAPLEVFNENFSEACEKEHHVLIDSMSADITYQVSVGYDREEPYIAYEDYWEKEPYITTESYYDSNTKSQRTRQVTKYKNVKKQRQVTKYKKVTDWSPLSGSHHTKSVSVAENINGQHLDEHLFTKSFKDVKDVSILPASSELSERMKITGEAKKNIGSKHSSNIDYSVRHSLPGDHSRDLDWKVSQVTASSSALYKVSEYEASICFDGKTYVKRAFPFGSMCIGGDKIKNEVSLDAVTRKMRDDLKKQNEDRKKAIEDNVSKATNLISLITIALLVVSIIVSLFIRSKSLIIIMFVLSVASFIFNTIKVKSENKAEIKRADEEIASEKARVEDEIKNYSKNYKIKQRNALDDKLKSLGYEPATAEEL